MVLLGIDLMCYYKEISITHMLSFFNKMSILFINGAANGARKRKNIHNTYFQDIPETHVKLVTSTVLLSKRVV